MKKFFYLFFICIIFMSCENNVLYDEMFRSTEDPYDEAPEVNSSKAVNTNIISWSKDDGTDYYILMKSEDNLNLSFSPIYTGKDTTYEEKVDANKMYVYRLDKVRGNVTFKGKSYGYGFARNVADDLCEDNNSIEKATYLGEKLLNCNLHYVEYLTNNKCDKDIDWYYVELEPGYTASVWVIENDISSETTHFVYEIPNVKSSTNVYQGTSGGKPILITNENHEKQKIYFCIYVNNDSSIFANGTNKLAVFSYSIDLISVQKKTVNN